MRLALAVAGRSVGCIMYRIDVRYRNRICTRVCAWVDITVDKES